MRYFRIECWLIIVLGLVTLAQGADPVKSGLQPGEKITTIFEPVNLNGEHAGEPYCLICENGMSPVAMVFAREVSPPLLGLLSRLEAATAKHRAQELGSFAVVLSEDNKVRDELAAAAKKGSYQRLIVSTYSSAGPDGFNVSPDADVTVVLYREHEVKANHAFRKGELTPAACDKVLADLPTILSK